MSTFLRVSRPLTLTQVELVDMFMEFTGGLVAEGMMVTGFIGTGMWIGVLGVVRGVVAVLSGFAGLGSGIITQVDRLTLRARVSLTLREVLTKRCCILKVVSRLRTRGEGTRLQPDKL